MLGASSDQSSPQPSPAIAGEGVLIASTDKNNYTTHMPIHAQSLDKTQILAAMEPASAAALAQILIFESLDSTNQYLLDHPELPSGTVCLAEQQTAGRGRRGRPWLSPQGSNIYFSMVWEFAEPCQLDGLSQAVGVATATALAHYGIQYIQLKWPNDIYFAAHKLGGILLESRQAKRVIIGIGINGSLPPDTAIDQAWTDIQTITGRPCARNQLIGLLLEQLLTMLPKFTQSGLASLRQQWLALDMLAQQLVEVQTAQTTYQGIAHGIDEYGRLRINCDGKWYLIDCADVTVRPV